MRSTTLQPFTEEALLALQQVLQQHGQLVWVDPAVGSMKLKDTALPMPEAETEAQVPLSSP